MRSTTIHLPTPCAESWAAMAPTGAGRHCAACQKTVVDFTQKTDAKILAHLARAVGGTCGRFRAGQVGRPLQPVETASRWRNWLGVLVAVGGLGQLLAGKVAAQTASSYYSPSSSTGDVAQPRNKSSHNSVGLPTGSLLLRGVVVEAGRKEGLPGATILLKGTNIVTMTNAMGEFELRIPAGYTAIHLVAQSIGYAAVERTVLSQAVSNPLPLTLELTEDVLGGLTVSYIPPAPWHPRALYQWGKYWVTRPFQR